MEFTIRTSCGCELSNPSTEELRPLNDRFSNSGILFGAGGFVSRNVGEAGDALGLLTVSLREFSHLPL